VSFIRAGYVRQRNGRSSNWLILPQAVQRAAPLFNNLAVFIDHASLATLFYPQLKDAVGVTFGPTWNGENQSIDGGVRLSNRPDLDWFRFYLQEFWEDQQAGREIPDVGMSAVLPGLATRRVVLKEVDGNEVVERQTYEISHAESVDFVFGPGAEGRIRSVLGLLNQFGGFTMDEDKNPAQETTTGQNSPPATPPPTPPTSGGGGAAPVTTVALAAQAAPTNGDGGQALEARILALTSQVDQLTSGMEKLTEALVGREERRVINDMGLGHAPRDRGAQLYGMTVPEDDFRNAVNWMFGVAEAKLPNPQLRSPKFLYEALTGDFAWQDQFDRGLVVLGSANPTTLPGMAVDAMNRVIIGLWDGLMTYRWFEEVVAVQPNNGTLHDMNWVQFGGISNLPVVSDGQPYTELTVDDSKETDAYIKYGGYVGITRKMLRNSDIARIQSVPRALAVAAVRTRSADIASIFTDNAGVGPTLDQDSTALFHSDHGNVATTAFSWAAWEAARLECYKQTELGSAKRHGLWPRYWLGPADLYGKALQYFGYGAGPGGEPDTAENNVNPYAESRPGDPRPVPLAVPEFTDTNDWAYVAAPMMASILQMSYSQNPGGRSHPLPELFSVASETGGLMFTADTMPIKVRDEYAFGVATYRGIGKRNVT